MHFCLTTYNKDKIISVQNSKSIEQGVSKFGNRRGTFIMISKEGVSYSGHVSIYNGKEVVGGNSNMHVSQAKVVYLYVADETKKKGSKQ